MRRDYQKKDANKKKAGAEDSAPRPVPRPILATSAQALAPVAPSVPEASMLIAPSPLDKPESFLQPVSAPLGANSVASSGSGTGAIPKSLSKRQKKIADRELKYLESQLKQSLISSNDPNESFVLIGTKDSLAESKRSQGAAIVSASVVKFSDKQELRVPPQPSYNLDQPTLVKPSVPEVTVLDCNSLPTNNQQWNLTKKGINDRETFPDKHRSCRSLDTLRSENKPIINQKVTKCTQTSFTTKDKGIQVKEASCQAANQKTKQDRCTNTSGRRSVVSTASRKIMNEARGINRDSIESTLDDFNKIFNMSQLQNNDEQNFNSPNVDSVTTSKNEPESCVPDIDLDSATDRSQMMKCLAAKYLPEWKQKLIFDENSSSKKEEVRDVIANKMNIMSQVAHIFYQLENLSATNADQLNGRDCGTIKSTVETHYNDLNDKEQAEHGQKTNDADAKRGNGAAAGKPKDIKVKVKKNQTVKKGKRQSAAPVRDAIGKQKISEHALTGDQQPDDGVPLPLFASFLFDDDGGDHISIQEMLRNLSEQPHFIFSDTTKQLLGIPDGKCESTKPSTTVTTARVGTSAEKVPKTLPHHIRLQGIQENGCLEDGASDHPKELMFAEAQPRACIEPKGQAAAGLAKNAEISHASVQTEAHNIDAETEAPYAYTEAGWSYDNVEAEWTYKYPEEEWSFTAYTDAKTVELGVNDKEGNAYESLNTEKSKSDKNKKEKSNKNSEDGISHPNTTPISSGDGSKTATPCAQTAITDIHHLAAPRTLQESKTIIQQLFNRMDSKNLLDLPLALCKEEIEILQAFRRNQMVLILSPKNPMSNEKQGNTS